jgi:probable HAF family extracellular repeat protein
MGRPRVRVNLRLSQAVIAANLVALWSLRILATPTYIVTDIGALGGVSSNAAAINNSGDVVGSYELDFTGTDVHAFIFSNGVATPIAPDAHYTTAYAINDNRQVTGVVNASTTSPFTYAFLYRDGAFASLCALNNPKGVSIGYGINRLGTIVGMVQSPSVKGMLYQNGAMTTLNNSNILQAFAINGTGAIVGTLQNNHGFVMVGNKVQDIGTLDGSPNTVSAATAINETGQVAGYSYFSGNALVHAILYENGFMKDLGTLRGGYSMAFGINNHGDVVGVSDGSGFLYHNGALIDLGTTTSDGVNFFGLEFATGINDRGQIVGRGTFAYIGTHAVLLTPQ